MPKIIALQSNNPQLAALLREQGYRVIDMYDAHKQRSQVAVYLYTTYHPDAFTSYNSTLEYADISVGNIIEDHTMPSTLMLNITSLEPAQILAKLEKILPPNREYYS